MPYRPVLGSPLKWAGGKNWLVPELSEIFNGYQSTAGHEVRLVDPFAGGLSLPLGLTPQRCLLSDVNAHLMNFWRWVQHGLEFEDGLGIIFNNDSKTYYENRDKFNTLCAAGNYWSKEGALLFYYLNRTCFNGLCRFNAQGFFNVPMGKYKNINYRTSFLEFKEAMEGWELYIGDFSTLTIGPEDFVYVDPPYDEGFTQFAQKDFTWEDQERLARWLANLPCPSAASNLATPRIENLYQSLGYTTVVREVPRRISCDGDRTPAREMLALKWK